MTEALVFPHGLSEDGRASHCCGGFSGYWGPVTERASAMPEILRAART